MGPVFKLEFFSLFLVFFKVIMKLEMSIEVKSRDIGRQGVYDCCA